MLVLVFFYTLQEYTYYVCVCTVQVYSDPVINYHVRTGEDCVRAELYLFVTVVQLGDVCTTKDASFFFIFTHQYY